MDMQKDADDLARYVQWFEESEEATDQARGLSERDRDYYDNKQLTDQERAALDKRGQPPIIVNRIKRKIDFLRGVETQQRSDPKAFPRTPQHEQDAEAATDALRFVAETTKLDSKRSRVWENMLIEGFGGCEVVVEKKRMSRDQMMGSTAMQQPRFEVAINHLPWDRIGYDPHSADPDFEDARYLFVVLWKDFEDALRLYPEGREALEATLAGDRGAIHDTYDDRPRWTVWADSKRKRVRIVQLWHREGEDWHFCTFTKGGKLESGKSPYEDEEGATVCPLVITSAYVDRENNRYGVVREMIGPQDEINKRRSKALHLMSVRQTFSSAGAVPDVNKAREELAKPDGHLDVAMGEFGRDFGILPTGDMAAAQFQLLQEAKNEIDLMGPNASMQGKGPDSQSGRAIIAQQQGGYIELGPVLDRLTHWNIRVYRAIWNRIRQFWTEERWIRVTDDERNVRFVGLNKPLTAAEAYQRELEQSGAPPEQIEAEMQRVAMHPNAGRIVGTDNRLAEMDVDIIVDDAPDTVTIQAEQFDRLASLVEAGFPIPPDVVIMSSQLRDKDKILDAMKGGAEQQAQAQAQMSQLQMDELAAKIAKTLAETQKIAAETQETMQPDAPEGQPGPTPLEAQETIANIDYTQARTIKTLVDASRPPPQPSLSRSGEPAR